MSKAKLALDAVDRAILNTLYQEGDILAAYRMWCAHYFSWEPKPKQELMVAAGFHPQALWSPDGVAYHKLYAVKNQNIVAAIRSGKSLGKGAHFLFLAWAFPGLELANMGPSVDQAATMFRLLLPFLGAKSFEKFVRKPDGGNPIQRHPYPLVNLWNGSTLEFRGAGKDYVEQIRSREYDAINVDEAALFSQYAISVLEGRILGAKAGRLRLGAFSLTTSKRATARWLYERALRGLPDNPRRDPEHVTIEMTTWENTSLDRKRVESIAGGMTQLLYQQEIENKWVDTGEAVYPEDVLMAAFSQVEDTTGIVGQLEEAVARMRGENAYDTELEEFMLPAERGRYYVAGMDLGKGRSRGSSGLDPSEVGQRGALTAAVLDVTQTPYRLVAFRYLPRTGHWARAISLARELRQQYPGVEIGWDSTGPGDVIDEVASGMGLGVEFPVKFLGHIAKVNIVRCLAWTLEHGLLKGPLVKVLFNQLRYYQLDDDEQSQDAAIALMIAAHVARQREEGASSGGAIPLVEEDARLPGDRSYGRELYYPGSRL